jgi:two-component system, LytTR family, response regulator AgrA
MKLNFIIADDEKSILESTCRSINKFISENRIDAGVTLCTTQPQEVLNYSNKKFEDMNVYILDINFQSKINGLTLARTIRERDPNAYIIFLTAHIQLSMMVFKYRLKVFDFWVKPVAYSDLSDCLKALIEDYSKILNTRPSSDTSFISVKSGYQDYNIPVRNIIYVESFGPKLMIHTLDSCIECYDTLKHIEESISKLTDTFFRSHKSFLINTRHIKEVDLHEQTVTMSTGAKCSISRSKKNYVKELSSGVMPR